MADVANQDRERRRLVAASKRLFEALARVGIDLETVPANNVEAHAILKANIARLSAIEMQMSKRVDPTAPTPERVAHAIEPPREIEVQKDQPKAHRFEWALEGLRDRLTSRQYEAAVRLRDEHLATQPSSRVADPTAVGGSSDPSKRLGITERQERAGRALAWVMGRLDQPFRSCIRNFVLEQVRDGAERCLNVSEWGAKTTGHAGEKAMRAAGAAAIILSCARLANIWDAYDQWRREQCSKTDRFMRTPIGRRAAQGGWICALWDFCHLNSRLPKTQGEMDQCRAIHDTEAAHLRQAPPIELDRWQRRRDKLTAMALRDEDERRVMFQ